MALSSAEMQELADLEELAELEELESLEAQDAAPAPSPVSASQQDERPGFKETLSLMARSGLNPLAAALGPEEVRSAIVRPVTKGLGHLALLPLDAAVGAINLASGPQKTTEDLIAGRPGQYPFRMPSAALDELLDKGTVKPQGAGKAAEFVSGALVGGAVPLPGAAGAARELTMLPKTGAELAAVRARQAGFRTPPTASGAGLPTQMMEGFAGKAAVEQRIAMKNQGQTNEIVRRALGLPEGSQITKEALRRIREREGTAYGEIAGIENLSADSQYATELAQLVERSNALLRDFPDASPAGAKEVGDLVQSLWRSNFAGRSAIEMMKDLRFKASNNLSWTKQSDPDARALGMAQREAANILEELVERNLAQSGRSELVTNFRNARQMIARTYAVEGALNESTGNVLAPVLGGMSKKGKPLDAGLEDIAAAARAFPKSMREVTESFPGVSPLDFALTLGIGMGGAGPMAAAYPAARIGLREALSSRLMQRPGEEFVMQGGQGLPNTLNALRGFGTESQ